MVDPKKNFCAAGPLLRRRFRVVFSCETSENPQSLLTGLGKWCIDSRLFVEGSAGMSEFNDPSYDKCFEVRKLDGRSSLSPVECHELKQLHLVMREYLARLDVCIRTTDRLELGSFQMVYRKAGDRALRDLVKFVEGVECAIRALTGEEVLADVSQRTSAPAATLRSPGRMAIWSSFMAALLLLCWAGSLWMVSTVATRRNEPQQPATQLGANVANIFTDGVTRRLESERIRFARAVFDNTGRRDPLQ
jgi:hypothetical protein